VHIKSINIGILGGTGSAGRALGHHIARNISFLKDEYNTNIERLYIIGRDIDKCDSSAQQIRESRGTQQSLVIPHHLDNLADIVESLDISVFAMEANQGHKDISTRELCSYNVQELVKRYAPLFGANKGTKIVLTNLTDIVTLACSQYSGCKYPDEYQKWVGMNNLDTFRFRSKIYESLVTDNIIGSSLDKVPLEAYAIGPHNNPICLFNWIKLKDIINLSGHFHNDEGELSETARQIINQVHTEADRHIYKIGNTTQPTTDAIFETILAIIDERSVVSASTLYPVGNGKQIYIGMPVVFKHYRAISQPHILDTISEQDENELEKQVNMLRNDLDSLASQGVLQKGYVVPAARKMRAADPTTVIQTNQVRQENTLVAATQKQHQILEWRIGDYHKPGIEKVSMNGEERSVFGVKKFLWQGIEHLAGSTFNGIFVKPEGAPARSYTIANANPLRGIVHSLDFDGRHLYGAHSIRKKEGLTGFGLYRWDPSRPSHPSHIFREPVRNIRFAGKVYFTTDNYLYRIEDGVDEVQKSPRQINSLLANDSYLAYGDSEGWVTVIKGKIPIDARLVSPRNASITSMDARQVGNIDYFVAGDYFGFVHGYEITQQGFGKRLFSHWLGMGRPWGSQSVSTVRLSDSGRVFAAVENELLEFDIHQLCSSNSLTEVLQKSNRYTGATQKIYSFEVY